MLVYACGLLVAPGRPSPGICLFVAAGVIPSGSGSVDSRRDGWRGPGCDWSENPLAGHVQFLVQTNLHIYYLPAINECQEQSLAQLPICVQLGLSGQEFWDE